MVDIFIYFFLFLLMDGGLVKVGNVDFIVFVGVFDVIEVVFSDIVLKILICFDKEVEIVNVD